MERQTFLNNTLDSRIINKENKIKTMPDNPQRVPAALGLGYMQSFGVMRVTMGYMTPQEQLETQHYCVWFYKYGAGRVQKSLSLIPVHLFNPCFFTFFDEDRELYGNVISVSLSG